MSGIDGNFFKLKLNAVQGKETSPIRKSAAKQDSRMSMNGSIFAGKSMGGGGFVTSANNTNNTGGS